jgi:hypothetical protein
MEGNATEFVINLNHEGFAVVSKRQLCMFGMLQSLIVMVMKNIVDNNVHLQKSCAHYVWLGMESGCMELHNLRYF